MFSENNKSLPQTSKKGAREGNGKRREGKKGDETEKKWKAGGT